MSTDDFEDSLPAKFLILRGQFQTLQDHCQRSAESQGERIGTVERDLRAYREQLDLFRQRTIALESRLVGAVAVVAGAVGVIELLRLVL